MGGGGKKVFFIITEYTFLVEIMFVLLSFSDNCRGVLFIANFRLVEIELINPKYKVNGVSR